MNRDIEVLLERAAAMNQEANLHKKDAHFLAGESKRLRSLAWRKLQEKLREDTDWKHVADKVRERDNERTLFTSTALDFVQPVVVGCKSLQP